MLATLTPLLLIAGLALAVPPGWRDRPGLKRVLEPLIATALAALVLRYLWWRLTVTVLPADTLSVQSAFVWLVFAIEMLSWLDAVILFMALLRRTDHSAAADRHAARLHRLPAA